MSAGRVLATQQAKDAANQLLALTKPVKEQVQRVLQHGGVLAEPSQWEGGLAGSWRTDWGPDANQLNQVAVKLDELGHRAQQAVDDIFKVDSAPLGAAAGGTLAGVLESPAQPESLHDDLLEEYQVSADPDGMTEWPPSWLPGPSMRVTATEADMLTDLQLRQGLRGTKAAYDIYQEALNRAENTIDGQGLTDGHADAFRHAYWNAMLTQRFGEEWAKEYATAHERNPESHPTPVAMDLHNNEVGRRIARENPDADQEELRVLVEQAVRDGEMVVVGTDNLLHHSDQVSFGDTRKASPWPTDNPQRSEHRDPGEPDAAPDYY